MRRIFWIVLLMLLSAIGVTLVLLPSLVRAATRNRTAWALTQSLANTREPIFLCDAILSDAGRNDADCDDARLCYFARVRANLAGQWTGSAPSAGGDDELSAFENGAAAWCRNDRTQALKLWSPYAAKFASHWTVEGFSALTSNNFTLAQQWFDAAWALKPSAKISVGLGQVAEARGDLTTALSDYDSALAQTPRATDTMLRAANAAFKMRDFARAQSYCERALALRQDDFLTWQVYGNALGGQKLWPQAEQAYRHAVALNPTYSTGNAGVAFTLAYQGKFDEARVYFANVVKYETSDKQKGGYLASFAWILSQSGDHRGAIEYLRQATGFDPKNPGFAGELMDEFVAAHDCDGLQKWLAERNAKGLPTGTPPTCTS